MIIGTGRDPSNTSDFNLQPAENMVRLCNWLYSALTGAEPVINETIAAVRRVAAHVTSNQREWPVTMSNCKWKDLAGLRTSANNCGPSCSDADIDEAIQSLPPPFSAAGSMFWNRELNYKPG